MNICRNCVHFEDIQGGSWYGMFCGHPKHERLPTTDPVTGEEAFQATNDLGRVIFVQGRFPNARDINTGGACKDYEAIEEDS